MTVEDQDIFWMDLKDIYPSQLYISKKKLKSILSRPIYPEALPPIPIIRLRGKTVSTDGHTRAVALFLSGYTKSRVVWDTDELDLEMYEICVEWCEDEGFGSVIDLATRLVDEEEYERLWLDRCSLAQRELDEKRKMMKVKLLRNKREE